MKKLGFTMSEIIIALGIIGVVSAIAAPTISNMMPDQNKTKVLKIKKVLTEINNELLSSKIYYWQPAGSDCEGFACTQEPLEPSLKNKGYSGDAKYPLLLAKYFMVKGTPTSSGFKTKDDLSWSFTGTFAANNFVVSVDVDPNKTGSTVYTTAKSKPDTFTFKITPRGDVLGEDALTKAYLQNPHKLSDRKADYLQAEKLLGK